MEVDWVSVLDRLPPKGRIVLVSFDGPYGFGARIDTGDGWLWGVVQQGDRIDPDKSADWNNVEVDDDYQPTHWAECPPKPVRATPVPLQPDEHVRIGRLADTLGCGCSLSHAVWLAFPDAKNAQERDLALGIVLRVLMEGAPAPGADK